MTKLLWQYRALH